MLLALLLSACNSGGFPPQEPGTLTSQGLVSDVRRLAQGRDIGPLEAPAPVRPELVRLGQALLFDKVLSGNHDISCMTCHHPDLAVGDGRHLAIGQGATGLGPERVHPEGAFIARNSPSPFNLHALDELFWDGRVSVTHRGGKKRGGKPVVVTPAGSQLSKKMEKVFEFGAASALGLFPVTSREEMRGFAGNELIELPDNDFRGIWAGLMDRLGAIPEYRAMFEDAYPGTRFKNMAFAHASNAMAGFIVSELSFSDTPWDRFLRGNDGALTGVQLEGAKNFLQARCSICHGGDALTDVDFHNVALAQFGPGTGDGDDFGRFNVTGKPDDKYAFRTPALRNVELTGPYGHAGQFVNLRDFIDHYSESDQKLFGYDTGQLEPALRSTLVDNFADVRATRDPLLDGVVFTDEVVDEVTAFMLALTDEAARDLTHLIPERVPSGLPVTDAR
jgi:cytochrome c peroxidase